MAEGDRQLAFTTGPVPTAVQVSGPDKITPKSVNASFDGTGAAGAFLPCLIITGRTGHEVARIPAPQVAAGASAEVSWFPRVAASSVSGGITATTEIASDGGFVNVPGNSTVGPAINWAHDAGTAALLDYTNPAAPTIITAGIYAISVNVFMGTAAFTPGLMAARFDAGPTYFLKGICPMSGTAGLDTPEVVLTLPPVHLNAGTALSVTVRQNSGLVRAFALQSPVGAVVTKLA